MVSLLQIQQKWSKRLKVQLKWFNSRVHICIALYQQTLLGMLDEVVEESKKSMAETYKTYDMFVLIIMGHGKEHRVSGVLLEEVYKKLSNKNFPIFKRKPKWIIVQACSGGCEYPNLSQPINDVLQWQLKHGLESERQTLQLLWLLFIFEFKNAHAVGMVLSKKHSNMRLWISMNHHVLDFSMRNGTFFAQNHFYCLIQVQRLQTTLETKIRN